MSEKFRGESSLGGKVEKGDKIESKRGERETLFRNGENLFIIYDTARPADHESYDSESKVFVKDDEAGWLVGGTFIGDKDSPFEMGKFGDDDENPTVMGGGLSFSGNKERRQKEYDNKWKLPLVIQESIEASIENAKKEK